MGLLTLRLNVDRGNVNGGHAALSLKLENTSSLKRFHVRVEISPTVWIKQQINGNF